WSSRRRHTRSKRDWSSDVCSSDLDTRRGRRPSFDKAAKPPLSTDCYERFVECLRATQLKAVKTGKFGAEMQLELVNDGPVTIVRSEERRVGKECGSGGGRRDRGKR